MFNLLKIFIPVLVGWKLSVPVIAGERELGTKDK